MVWENCWGPKWRAGFSPPKKIDLNPISCWRLESWEETLYFSFTRLFQTRQLTWSYKYLYMCIYIYIYIHVYPPDPTNHVKILRAGPADLPFGSWYLTGQDISAWPFWSGENERLNHVESSNQYRIILCGLWQILEHCIRRNRFFIFVLNEK